MKSQAIEDPISSPTRAMTTDTIRDAAVDEVLGQEDLERCLLVLEPILHPSEVRKNEDLLPGTRAERWKARNASL
jgi:hypothetical protein